MVKLQLVEDL